MTPLLAQIPVKPLTLAPTHGDIRTEAEVIAGRIASHRHWTRRRRTLRLRAALFGRRKQAARPVPAPAATPARQPAAA